MSSTPTWGPKRSGASGRDPTTSRGKPICPLSTISVATQVPGLGVPTEALAAVTTYRLLLPRAAPRPEPPPCPRAPLLCTPLTRAPKIKYHLVSRKTSVMPHCSPAGPQLAFCLPVTCHEVLQRRVKPRCGNAVYTAQKVPRLLVHGHVAAGHWQDQKLLWALQTPVGHGGTTGLVIACHRHRRQR